MLEPDRPQMAIRLMRVPCWITKATDAHSEYDSLLLFNGNSETLLSVTFCMYCAWRMSINFGTLGNGVPKTVFELNMREVTGDWRALCDKELHNFRCSSNNDKVE